MKTGLTQNTIKNLKLGVGILCKNYDLGTNEIQEEDIICATRGGGTVSCVPSIRQIPIDGARENTKGLQVIDHYTVTLTATAVEFTPENMHRTLGAADVQMSPDEQSYIIPRHQLIDADYNDVYWVGYRSDGATIVIHLMNTINTTGLTITDTDKGESTFSLTLTAHYDLQHQDAIPFAMIITKGKPTMLLAPLKVEESNEE